MYHLSNFKVKGKEHNVFTILKITDVEPNTAEYNKLNLDVKVVKMKVLDENFAQYFGKLKNDDIVYYEILIDKPNMTFGNNIFTNKPAIHPSEKKWHNYLEFNFTSS